MLKITRKVEYALIALRHMQHNASGSLVSAKQQMSRDGLISAVKGPTGGYKISADLNSISLKDFFEKIEGPLGLMDCYFSSDCNQLKSCNILTPIQRINQNMRDMFSKTSLQEITQ